MKNKNLLSVKSINMDILKSKVYLLRGVQIMLDCDLAEIYGYEVRALNQQVKRNILRFPKDFMFQLNREELELVKSQFVTSSNYTIFQGNTGGTRKLPYAFTEQGIYMLATVLKGELAEKQSIFIIRAFKEMRHFIKQNMQFVSKNEIKILTDRNEERFSKIENSIDKINEKFLLDIDKKNFVIYKGQKFEADKAYIDIYQKATRSIYIIDDYVNTKSLELLSHKKKNVKVIIFTDNKGKSKGNFITQSEITDFNDEYPSIQIKPNNKECHDRFIIIDYKSKNECVYICGASSKDAGNKVCTINLLETKEMIYPVINKLLSR